MLRPILAFCSLTLAAFILAPTVESVHERITDLHIERETPWQIWTWTNEPLPSIPIPDCGSRDRHLYSEITQWPARIRKDQAFTLRGFVGSEEERRQGVRSIDVDVFLNETKNEPGVLLGKAESGDGGFFTILAKVPFDLEASHYHIVAHAKQEQIDCALYLEHWSDPETDVVSKTKIHWDPVEHAVAGREFEVTGHLVDSVKAPVRNATVLVTSLGETQRVRTGGDGSFRITVAPSKPGNVTLVAEYRGGAYYEGTRNQTAIVVDLEDLALDGETDPITLVRSQPMTLSGHVYVAPAVREDEITLAFAGARVATCATCPAGSRLRVPVDAHGAFRVDLVVPPSEPGANATLVVSGGGLNASRSYDVSVEVPTTLRLRAHGTGLFTRGFDVNATLADETGRPIDASIAILTPGGRTTERTDANGTVLLSGMATCGGHPVDAAFGGAPHLQPSSARAEMFVCGWLAFLPPWLLVIPWWVWPLAALVGYVGWWLARNLRQKYAPIISSGPPLALAFTEPADDGAPGYAGFGEPVVASAFLEAPLPDGHTLRMGASRATHEQPLDGELRAHLRIVPDTLGTIPIRAEIVDPKGKVVTRRTVQLHVVRYAQEIERRYLGLRAAAGATDSVTPREFERWLRERAPGLDATIARRLVHVFEEADYSPRAAGRAEFAAYVAAERGIMEVTRDVAHP